MSLKRRLFFSEEFGAGSGDSSAPAPAAAPVEGGVMDVSEEDELRATAPEAAAVLLVFTLMSAPRGTAGDPAMRSGATTAGLSVNAGASAPGGGILFTPVDLAGEIRDRISASADSPACARAAGTCTVLLAAAEGVAGVLSATSSFTRVFSNMLFWLGEGFIWISAVGFRKDAAGADRIGGSCFLRMACISPHSNLLSSLSSASSTALVAPAFGCWMPWAGLSLGGAALSMLSMLLCILENT
jgi:hypothetical protein